MIDWRGDFILAFLAFSADGFAINHTPAFQRVAKEAGGCTSRRYGLVDVVAE